MTLDPAVHQHRRPERCRLPRQDFAAKLGVYRRVSTLEQVEHGSGLDAQCAAIKADDHRLVKCVAEELSGASDSDARRSSERGSERRQQPQLLR